MEPNALLIALLLLVTCTAAFFAGTRMRKSGRTQNKTQTPIPQHWPLNPRRMINSQERKIWAWLRQAFPEHHIMVKVAVTRFLLPRRGEDSRQLYQVLNGVHCTFTVCGNDGRVVGCVDVPGSQGISRVHRQIKLTLLSQCGIVYRVIQPDHLPAAAEIRIDFLGEDALALFNREKATVTQAQQDLRATVEKQRRHQRTEAPRRGEASVPPDTEGGSSGYETEFAPSAWQQPNSFLAPLDSRLAGLQ